MNLPMKTMPNNIARQLASAGLAELKRRIKTMKDYDLIVLTGIMLDKSHQPRLKK